MSENCFRTFDGQQSYLNDEKLIQIVEAVYRIRRCHGVKSNAQGTTGVPGFVIRSFLSGQKISSMPFNFYPPLTGVKSNVAGMDYLIDQARMRNRKFYAEYKTFERLPAEYCESENISETVFSIVSDLALRSSHEEQRRLYKKRHRTKVNKARSELEHLEVSCTRSQKELHAWYDLLLRLYRNKHRMICQPFGLYRRLLEHPDLATLLVARDAGETVGGVFLLHDASRWDYCWGTTSDRYDRRNLASLLLDHAVGLAIEGRAQAFGFGSSAPSDTNLLFFKQRWGCTEKIVYAYYWNSAPRNIDLNDSFSVVRNVIGRTPLWFLKMMSPLLVPHLV